MPVSERLTRMTSWRVEARGSSMPRRARKRDDQGPVAMTAVSVSYVSVAVFTAVTRPLDISTPVAGDSRTTDAPISRARVE